ncbi:hypothetical protein EV126DRAFT_97249 [Verticillium dahliae]|nr:hypothetical protein EV126DRAFT_97249 [Verticillium dahliae]
MVFNPHPTGFRTKHWRKLYESYILDINSLRQVVASGGIFVFVDAEPWGADSSKPAEIGLSLLPSLDLITNANTSSTMLWTLDNLSTEHCIETHRFRVLGRDRQEKRRQPHRFGQKYEIVDEEIEKSISDIIQRFHASNIHTHLDKLPSSWPASASALSSAFSQVFTPKYCVSSRTG